MEEIKDVTRLLPDDALAAVLARLAPRGLATCRRVYLACRRRHPPPAAHGPPPALGRPRLPYLNVSYRGFPPLFHRPSTAPASTIRDDLDYLRTAAATDRDDVSSRSIQDHSNGLLLFPEHVVNPVTRQCVRLPPRPPIQASGEDFHHYLAV
uniref:F-box domain-containing protein n=1 Tax=Setaria viridis TaxID=4556 RepID=A0A4U6T552_SETVI|nr:LOW QUALITY PROTEIN: hypothetical protein SEVIR_9G136300v2 [Setaria viridis]